MDSGIYILNFHITFCILNDFAVKVRTVLGWTTTEMAMREPAYLSHLAFLDKIFAEWYHKTRSSPTQVIQRHNLYNTVTKRCSIFQFPEQLTAPGHSLYSYMIPFVPMTTHASMLTDIENLGYVYE
jgi:hypothetical protein